MIFIAPAQALAEPTAGSVNNWFTLSNAKTLSVDITPTYGEDGYHFYSLTPFFQDQTYAVYSGIQTNGNFGNGVEAGNLFIFSAWNATAAYPAAGTTTVPFSTEGSGYSLRKKYDWKVGTTYKVTIKRETYDAAKKGYRWSSTITNKTTGVSLKLGELTAPSGANLLRGGSAFHERYAGVAPVCTGRSSNLEKAGVTFSSLTSDKPVSFSGTPQPNNIFASTTCKPFIKTSSTSTTASTIFGYSAVPTFPTFPCLCQTNRQWSVL